MKALWIISFRPIGKSKINDFFQNMFIDSLQCIDFDIKLSITQFDEPNIKEFVEKKNMNCFFENIPKHKLPTGKKYSNKIMLDNALDQLIEKDFDYLIYSTADIIVPNRIFEYLSKIQLDEFCALIYPNIHITNGIIKNNFWPHYGIDLIIFKISKKKALVFKEIIKSYDQYDWGIIENFYISISEALNLKKINLFKYCNVIKFDNDFGAFKENRTTQKKSWNENQKYFLNFLKKNKLSKLYAYGSYYYLLFKIFNLRDLNFSLFLSYLIFYPYNLALKIFTSIKRLLIK